MKFQLAFTIFSLLTQSSLALPKENNFADESAIRASEIRTEFQNSWAKYKEKAFGADEIRPISGEAVNNTWNGWGVTLVDSLSTLWIMDLKTEFNEAKEFVSRTNYKYSPQQNSFFEITIRYLAGLISAHDLSGEKVFLDKAKELADSMLPAFNSPSGYPYVTFDFETGKPVKDPYGSLANVGTCQLEFTRLSLLTGDNKYRQAALKVFDTLDKNKAGKGLYYNEVNIQTGKYASTSFSLGAGADSFFEYLIKLYIMLGPKDTTRNKYLTMFDDSMTVMKQKLLTKCYKNRLCLGHTDSSGRLINEMHHLEFFIPAMLLLGNEHLPSKGLKPIALDLLETYSAIPQLTVTGLAPENTRFSNTSEIQVASRQNYLRPELVESLFYGYRNTEDKKYQDRSYALFKAFQTYSKTNYGFAEYMDVNSKDKQQQQHDVMGSFFYAEAMKYMYLIHAPKNTFDFSKWVFNTEAHPFKISNA